jgi:zinc transporter 2
MIVLMEGMPKGVNFVDVLETFMSIDGVVRVHNLRVWALSPDKIALAAHLAVGKYNHVNLFVGDINITVDINCIKNIIVDFVISKL